MELWFRFNNEEEIIMAKKITVFALLALILLINIGCQGTAPEEQRMTRDEYVADIVPLLESLIEGVSLIDTLIANYEPGGAWKEKFELVILLTIATYDDIRKLNPPKESEESHNYLLKALDAYETSYYYLNKGIEYNDRELLKVAAHFKEIGYVYMVKALEEID